MSGPPPTINLFPQPGDPTPILAETSAINETPVLLPIRPTVRVRTLHVINGEHFSGAERVQDLLALRLPGEGFPTDFAALKPNRFGEVRQSTCRLEPMKMRGRLDFHVVGQIKQMVQRHHYQILHAHTPRSALVTAIVARSMGLPWIYHVHSPVSRDSTRVWQDRVNGWVEWFSVRSATRVIVVSPSLLPYMRARGVDANRLVCVPNGVPSSDHARRTRAIGKELQLGMVALFRSRKGTEVLLEAMANAISRGNHVRLRLIGGFETPEYEQRIRDEILRLDLLQHVDLVGFTTEVDRELAQLDAMVLPSLHGEGLPMVLLEAMAAGVPVIASHVEGASTAIEHRESGLLVEPGSVSQLADAIEEFATREIDHVQLASYAQQRHAEQFSDVAMARGVAAVYREVLEESC